MIRRLISPALVLALAWGLATRTEGSQAAAATRPSVVYASAHQKATSDRGDWRIPQCRFRFLDGRSSFSDWEVKRTIRCAAERWTVPGGPDGALCIAEKESGFNELADNSTSTAAGVYQFVASTWTSVKASFEMPWWVLLESVYNARSNVIRAIRKANAAHTWYPAWTVAPLCGLA